MKAIFEDQEMRLEYDRLAGAKCLHGILMGSP